MRTFALLAAAAASLLLAACASSTVTKTGTTSSYPPLAPMAEVAIFTAESAVGQPFELVANISYTDPGKYAILSLFNSYEPLKTKAREVGANGVIIDNFVAGNFRHHLAKYLCRCARDPVGDATRGGSAPAATPAGAS
jgi:hypothetical protein